MHTSIDGLDALILNRMQGDFPVSEDPYAEIGLAIGVSGEEVLLRVRGLVERGVVRKVGPFFDARKMSYVSTLCALHVPEEKLADVAALINAYPEVTHNYLRAGMPNLWFTVIAESKTAIQKIIGEIEEKGGVGPVRDLPASRMFKVKVDLKVGE